MTKRSVVDVNKNQKNTLDWIILGLVLIVIGLLIFIFTTGCGGGGGGATEGGGNDGTGSGSGTGSIQGQVIKCDTGFAQSGATVVQGVLSDTTTASGNFNLAGVSAGVKTVEVIKSGYQTCKKNVQVTSSGTAICDIKMPPNASGIVPPPITTGIDDVNGPAGQTVTITGNGLGASEGVINFGGFQADVMIWALTSIQAKVPIGLTGQVDVEVIRFNDGQKSGNNIKFTLTP